jgi:hypothetical protein
MQQVRRFCSQDLIDAYNRARRTKDVAVVVPPGIQYDVFREFLPTMGDDMLWDIYGLASTTLRSEQAIRYYARRHNIRLPS